MNKLLKLQAKAVTKKMEVQERIQEILANNKGESQWSNMAVLMLIGVVIGGVVLAALYAMFGDKILPTLEEKIMDIFDYKG